MDFTYTVKKSKRKTYSIRITDDNKIIVHTPLHATDRNVKEIVEKKRAWIEKVLAFNNSNSLNVAGLSQMQCAYVNGVLMPVSVGGRNFIDDGGVHVASYNSFKSAYVNGAGNDFLSRFKETEQRCRLKSKSVSFRSYKSRWGCCDGENNIIFNFKLMMLPVSLQEYVMVHELCHTIYHNHSREFWTLVKKYMPDCMERRKQLKNYNFLVNMY
ncbi:MAG: M48 family metallopeptidase [Clostridia bacterium]|nr:M48 family metallopeptidase [Clostridia bacterium]